MLCACAAMLFSYRRSCGSPMQVAKRAQVLAATVAGSGDQLLRETDLAFPLVIVDEAAQIPEAHCLIPLVQGAQVNAGISLQMRVLPGSDDALTTWYTVVAVSLAQCSGALGHSLVHHLSVISPFPPACNPLSFSPYSV